jgi:AraC-like DNA-binding protein
LIDHVQEQLAMLEQQTETKLLGMLRLCSTYGHQDEPLAALTAAYKSVLIVRFSGAQPTLPKTISDQFSLSVELWNLEQCCWLYLSERQNLSALGAMLRDEVSVLNFVLDDYTPDRLHEQFVSTMKNKDQQRCNAIANYCSTSPDNLEAAICLIKQMEIQSGPPIVLDTFCSAVGLILPFWRAVAMTAECAQGRLDAATLNALLRALPSATIPHSKDVQLTMQWVQTHYSESVTLTQAAANVYLQANYFSTLFKKETGISFIQYLNGLRVDAACRYILEHADASFEQVAGDNGFVSLRYFFSTFKRYTGLTPGDFRSLLPQAGLAL